jgi:hypothetical protein
VRKQSRKSLVRTLDKAFGDYIKERDRQCVCCGEINQELLQCGHLFTRAAYSTRWDERNAFCQCSSCNLRHEYDPGDLTNYFLRKFGQGEYALLHRIHRTPRKYRDAELQELIADYRNRLAEMKLMKQYA